MTNPAEPNVKGRRGCLFYGLLIFAVVLLLILAGALVGVYYAKKMVRDFTEEQARPLPEVQMPPAEYQALQRRIDEFRKNVRGGLPAEPLTLGREEINALIENDPDFAALKDKLYLDAIEGDQLKGQLSVPMEQLNLPLFKGRHLNADVTFRLSLNNGILRLTPQDISVKGAPVPDVYMDTLRKQNLARPINSDPRASVALDKLDGVRVENGKLVVVPKKPGT